MNIQAREIKNIPYGGSVNQGQGISFVLQFQDDTHETYACSLAVLQLLFGNLTQYANMAERTRARMPDRSIAEAAPYRVTDVVRSGHSTDGQLVSVDFATTHGFPLSVAMTVAQAQQTIEFLQREILLAEEAPQTDRPN